MCVFIIICRYVFVSRSLLTSLLHLDLYILVLPALVSNLAQVFPQPVSLSLAFSFRRFLCRLGIILSGMLIKTEDDDASANQCIPSWRRCMAVTRFMAPKIYPLLRNLLRIRDGGGGKVAGYWLRVVNRRGRSYSSYQKSGTTCFVCGLRCFNFWLGLNIQLNCFYLTLLSP